MRATISHSFAGATMVVSTMVGSASPAYAQAVDCTPLLANYVCAYPDGLEEQIAVVVSVTGDVRVSDDTATNQISSDTPIAAGDSVLTGEGGAFYDAGAQCSFTIGQQTALTTGIVDACVVVSVTDQIIPAATPVLFGDAHTLLTVLGVGGGVAAYFLLQEEEDEQDPVTPP